MPSVKDIPLLTIVVPVFNDEEYIARALDTAINQSLKNIEIICVDDCSTDDTVRIIQKYIKKDPRVKLIRHKENASAFQARLSGVKEARANYILFLDGDDELHKDAAKLCYREAKRSGSDMVGFGSRVVRLDGSFSRDFEKSLQPVYPKLMGSSIVAKLFEPGKPAQGSVWRYLFSKSILEKAYSYFPEGQRIYRTNDLPISFLAASLAHKYTSIKNRLYTYHYYAGGSGSHNFSLDKFKFYTKAIDSISLIEGIINTETFNDRTKASFHSARLFVLSNIVKQIDDNIAAKDRQQAINFLFKKVPLDEVVASIATFNPRTLDTLRNHLPNNRVTKKSRKVALFTNNLHTGGLQGVVLSQAKYLRNAGFTVTVILLKDNDIAFEIPEDIAVEFVEKGPIYIRLKSFKSILVKNEIDTVIDHSILYNFTWPFFNLIAKSVDAHTHAWIHTFSLRTIIEGSLTGKFLNDNISLVDNLAVLSKADVSYWKSIGHKNTYYIPNPPSPLVLDHNRTTVPRKAPKSNLSIVWFGRLQQSSKKVLSLIDIAAELRKLTDNFTLTIIGPESNDLSIRQVKEEVQQRSLEKHIQVTGPKHGKDLIKELKKAHIYLSTSIIEGYQLSLVEAQTYALPVVMYELPWLTVVENNKGVIQTPQKNPKIAAQEIYNLFSNKHLYEELSEASLIASKKYLSYDFGKVFSQFLQGKLPKEFSPEINIQHMGIFTKWTQFYFAELLDGSSSPSSNNISLILRKDNEIKSLKNSRAMKIGTTILKPARKANTMRQKVIRRLKNT